MDKVEIEVITIEEDRVCINFYATDNAGNRRHLGDRALFEKDRWEVVGHEIVVRRCDA